MTGQLKNNMRRHCRIMSVATNLVTVCICGRSAADDELIDLILVAGQSNAVGYDAKPSELPEDAADEKIMFWWRCGDPPPDAHDSVSGGKWTQLQPQPLGNPKKPRQGRQYGNFAQAEGGFGPEIALARALHKQQGRKLAVIKAAFSGTGIRKDWNHHDPGDAGSRCTDWTGCFY